MGGGVVAGAEWDGAWTIGAGSGGRGAGATSRGAIGGGVRARASAPRGGTAPPGFSRGKPRVPPEGASGFRDDDRARVGWRATRARASKGVARAANVPPDRRGAPGRVAILRASRRGARDRRGWSRAARAPRHRTAPRRASRGARFQATPASKPRPVPRAPSSSCSRDGPSRVPRSVERGARSIARGALRGSAAHVGRRASLLLPTKQEPLAVSEDEIFRSVVGPRRRRRRTNQKQTVESAIVVVTTCIFYARRGGGSLAECSFDIHNDTASRAHTSASASLTRNHPTPCPRGVPAKRRNPRTSAQPIASKNH